jgi:hypothetical protein
VQDQERAEEAAKRNLQPLTALFREPFESAHTVLETYASQFADRSEIPSVSRCQTILLSRLADDLRTGWLLAERAYEATGSRGRGGCI